jgi:NAD+ kinase
MKYQSVVVIAHPQIEGALVEAEAVAAYLSCEGITTTSGSLYDEEIHCRVKAGEFDLVIALGGDGTMLRAGHFCAPHNIPILGINMGRFGFMMEVSQETWREMICRLIEGNFWLEKRMMLHSEHWHEDMLQGNWDVLNEAVVSRGQVGRPVHLTAHVDQRFLSTFVADGLIVATPTGSTAYALAAGGPILPPELRNILLVPLAPHLSIDRSIVLAEGATVAITVHTTHQAILSNDGQEPIPLQDNDHVTVRASEFTVQFIRFQDPGYFYRNLTPHMSRNPALGNHR